MRQIDESVINKLQEKFGWSKEKAKSMIDIIRAVAMDEYDKRLDEEVPF